mgnify:CR=1 FL=1
MAKNDLKLLIAVVGAKEAQQQLQDFARAVKKGGQEAITTSKGMGRMRVATAGLRRNVGQLRNVLLLASFATAALRKASKGATQAFIEQAEAETLLRVGMQRTSDNAGKASERLIQYASVLQQSTKFGDEAIIAQMAMLTQFGANEAAVAELIPHILNLAVGQNGLESVTRAVGQSIRGQTGMMSRLGIQIDELSLAQARARGSAEEFKFLLDVLSTAARGNQEALRELRTSELKQMEMKLGDLSEKLGEVLVPFEIWTKELLLKGIKFVHMYRIEIEKLGLIWDRTLGKITVEEYLEGLKKIDDEMEKQAKTYEILVASIKPYIEGEAEIVRTLRQRIDLMRINTKFEIASLEHGKAQFEFTNAELEQRKNDIKLQEFQNMLREQFGDDEMKIREGKKKNISLLIMEFELLAKSAELQRQINREKIEGFAAAFGGFKELAIQQKAGAEAVKGLAIAEALINSYLAFTKALPNYALAAGALASGFAQVAKIRATKFASGGLVGGSTVGDQMPAMLQSGEFVLSRDAVRNIGVEAAEAINAGSTAGVTVNINAPLVDETVRDSILPSIEKALRLNTA